MKLRGINDKKGQAIGLSGMPGAIVAIGVAIIVLVISMIIVQEIRNTDIVDKGATPLNGSDNTDAFTAVNQSLVGLGTFGDFISIIVLAVVAGIVLGVIFGVFGRRAR